MQNPDSNGYQFTAKPRVMQPIAKYRQAAGNEEIKTVASLKIENLMHDRRVIRGSTYSMNLLKPGSQSGVKSKISKGKQLKTDKTDSNGFLKVLTSLSNLAFHN